MSKDELNQDEDIKDDETSEGDSDEEASDELEDELFGENLEDEEEEEEEDQLALINKKAKKNFKSVDDLVKTLKQSDKEFAQKGQRKEKDSKPQGDMAEEILTLKFPESETVLSDLREQAKSTGKDVLSIYKNSTYLQKEASARAEAKKNKEGINKPSSDVIGEESVGFTLSDADKALIKAKGWTKKQFIEKYKASHKN